MAGNDICGSRNHPGWILPSLVHILHVGHVGNDFASALEMVSATALAPDPLVHILHVGHVGNDFASALEMVSATALAPDPRDVDGEAESL